MKMKNLSKINLGVLLILACLFILGCSRKDKVIENISQSNISNVQVINIGDSYATITWITDEPSTSHVEYGIDIDYFSGVFNSRPVEIHSITITNLISSTTYHFQIKGTTVTGDLITDIERTFTTFSKQ